MMVLMEVEGKESPGAISPHETPCMVVKVKTDFSIYEMQIACIRVSRRKNGKSWESGLLIGCVYCVCGCISETHSKLNYTQAFTSTVDLLVHHSMKPCVFSSERETQWSHYHKIEYVSNLRSRVKITGIEALHQPLKIVHNSLKSSRLPGNIFPLIMLLTPLCMTLS